MSLLPIYKRIGITPFELVNEAKNKYNIKEKVSYLGRLDPMAHGLMVLLVGSETKNQNKYQKLDKVYEYKVLFDDNKGRTTLLLLLLVLFLINSFLFNKVLTNRASLKPCLPSP